MTFKNNESDVLFWDILKFLWKHRKLLLIWFFTILIGSYVVLRFVVTPKFESEAVIYPANFIPVSSEDPTEQAVQMLNSGDIRDKIIDSFGLIEHYKFDPSDFKMANLLKAYEQNFSIDPTNYSSINITVLDADPEKAAQMANALVDLLSKKMLAIKKEKFDEWAVFYREKYEDKKARIDEMEGELKTLREENGILNLEEQSAALVAQITSLERAEKTATTQLEYYKNTYVKAKKDTLRKYEFLKSNATQTLAELRPKFDKWLSIGDKILGGLSTLELERESLADYKAQYEDAVQNAGRKISYSYSITTASPSDKPAYPKKITSSLILAISSLAALCFVLLFLEKLKQIKQEMA